MRGHIPSHFGKIGLHELSFVRRIRLRKTPIFFLALAFALTCSAAAQAGPKGYLFIIGGGERDAPLMKRYVQLAAGFGTGKVVVFTMASGVPQEVGPELVAEFKANGVKDVVFYQLTHEEAMRPDSARILDGVGGVWFAGGDQARLTAALLDTPIHKKMLELYEKGCVIGGTSAGAAVMSEVMITGDEKRNDNKEGSWEVIWANDVIRTRGFGFVKNAIIDQHFVTRRRLNRLIATVIENPKLVGVGIDESTAVLVRPDGRYEVLGESQVLVFDARRAKTFKAADNRLGAHGMTLQVLLPGDVYDVATGKVAAR
jgi:cyanophycinase